MYLSLRVTSYTSKAGLKLGTTYPYWICWSTFLGYMRWHIAVFVLIGLITVSSRNHNHASGWVFLSHLSICQQLNVASIQWYLQMQATAVLLFRCMCLRLRQFKSRQRHTTSASAHLLHEQVIGEALVACDLYEIVLHKVTQTTVLHAVFQLFVGQHIS